MNAEELKEYIQSEIEKIKTDERYSYPPADIFINAPLALIQVDMKARVRVLEKILKVLE